MKSVQLLLDIHRYVDGIAKVDDGNFINTVKRADEFNKFIKEFNELSRKVTRGTTLLDDNINRSDSESFGLNKENYENIIVDIDMLRIKMLNILKSYGVSQLELSRLMDAVGDIDLKLAEAAKLVN